MLIAIDFDDTYTRDPELWNNFISNAKNRNHEIICVTMRYPEEGKEVSRTIGVRCKVIFTERKAKKKFLKTMNIRPDVWIDDNPLWIYQNG